MFTILRLVAIGFILIALARGCLDFAEDSKQLLESNINRPAMIMGAF